MTEKSKLSPSNWRGSFGLKLRKYNKDEILFVLENGSFEEMVTLPLAVGMNFPDWTFSQFICCKLCENESDLIRANAVLGLAHIARTKGKLEKEIVKPYIINEVYHFHPA